MSTIFDTKKYDVTISHETTKDKVGNKENAHELTINTRTIPILQAPLERLSCREKAKVQTGDKTEEVYGTLMAEEELPVLQKEVPVTKYIYLEDKGTFYDTTTDNEYVKSDIIRRKLSIELDKKISDDEVRYMIKS